METDRHINDLICSIKDSDISSKDFILKGVIKKNPEYLFPILKELFKDIYFKYKEKIEYSLDSIEAIFYEIIEDICFELPNTIKEYNKNIFVYLKNQISWRMSKKTKSNIRNIQNLEYNPDNYDGDEGYYNFFEGFNYSYFDLLFWKEFTKTSPIKIDYKDTEDKELLKFMFGILFPFLKFEKVIDDVQLKILTLRIIEDKKFEEISVDLKITLNIVKKKYYKASNDFKVYFSYENISNTYFRILKFFNLDYNDEDLENDISFKKIKKNSIANGHYDFDFLNMKESDGFLKDLLRYKTLSELMNNKRIKNLYDKYEGDIIFNFLFFPFKKFSDLNRFSSENILRNIKFYKIINENIEYCSEIMLKNYEFYKKNRNFFQ